MFLILVGFLLIGFGFVIYAMTVFMPILRLVGMDWIAIFVIAMPYFIALYRIYKSRCWNQVNGLPMWKVLVKYLRRDNECVELIGERAYPGESFIDIPQLGLMEYLGKDCNYSFGNGKFVFGLENINFSPDPHYFNLNHLMYDLGFCDTDDVKNVLNGEDLELMGRVYLNMQRSVGMRGAAKLVTDMKNYSGTPKSFDVNKKYDSIHNKVDKLIKV